MYQIRETQISISVALEILNITRVINSWYIRTLCIFFIQFRWSNLSVCVRISFCGWTNWFFQFLIFFFSTRSSFPFCQSHFYISFDFHTFALTSSMLRYAPVFVCVFHSHFIDYTFFSLQFKKNSNVNYRKEKFLPLFQLSRPALAWQRQPPGVIFAVLAVLVLWFTFGLLFCWFRC